MIEEMFAFFTVERELEEESNPEKKGKPTVDPLAAMMAEAEKRQQGTPTES
jgi:hypothetical protein